MLWLLSLFGQVQGNLPELSGEDKQECTHVMFREYPECDPTASTPAPNPSEAATMSLRQFTKHLTFGSMQCFQMRKLRFRLKSIDHKHTGRGRAEMCTLTALIPRRRISPLAERTRYLQSYPIIPAHLCQAQPPEVLAAPRPSANPNPSCFGPCICQDFPFTLFYSFTNIMGHCHRRYFKSFVHQILNSFQATLL